MDTLRSTQARSSNTINEEQILEEVLGRRRGFNRGRGRIVKAQSSSIDSTAQSHRPIGRVYTQDEVDRMFATERERTQAQIQSQMSFILQTLNSQGIPISFPEIPTSTCTPLQTHTTQYEDEDEEEEEDDGEEDDGAEEEDE